MKTQKVKSCGWLKVGTYLYHLVQPSPLLRDWEKDDERRFLVVPAGSKYDAKLNKDVYPVPRHIVVHGDWHIDYDVSIQELECELPNDITDLENLIEGEKQNE